MGPLLALAAGSTALNIASGFAEASSARRSMDNKATALKQAANRRLEKGRQEKELLIAKGGADQTSYFANMLSSGGDRRAMATDLSLDEISNRAKFAADQAMADAQYEADNMIADANAYSQQGRDAQKSAWIGATSSILGLGSSYMGAKYGNDAANIGWSRILKDLKA